MSSNSEKKIETIEQFREWLNQPAGIQLENKNTSLFEVPINKIPPIKLTPEDEEIMFNQMPVGSTKDDWTKKLSEWIESFMESHTILK